MTDSVHQDGLITQAIISGNKSVNITSEKVTLISFLMILIYFNLSRQLAQGNIISTLL